MRSIGDHFPAAEKFATSPIERNIVRFAIRGGDVGRVEHSAEPDMALRRRAGDQILSPRDTPSDHARRAGRRFRGQRANSLPGERVEGCVPSLTVGGNPRRFSPWRRDKTASASRRAGPRRRRSSSARQAPRRMKIDHGRFQPERDLGIAYRQALIEQPHLRQKQRWIKPA